MPYEIDAARYLDLVDEVEDRVGSATIVTSWHSDFAFFEFMRPDASHVLTLASQNDSPTEFFRSPAMRQWLGDGRYAADLPELCDLSEPVVLVGWSYNPSVLNLAAFGRMLGLFEQDELVARLGLRHHLRLSAFWPEFRHLFDPLARVGDYRAYRFAADRACAGSAR